MALSTDRLFRYTPPHGLLIERLMMSFEERWLPLFPLNMVLFPGMSIPLNIFEERYKLMINSCLENDSKFGVILIKAGQ